MFADKIYYFNEFYEESRKEAHAQANELVKLIHENADETGSKLTFKFLNKLRFPSSRTTVRGILLILLAMILAYYISWLVKHGAGYWSIIIYFISLVVIALIVLTYIILSIFLSDKAWSEVSVAERRALTAQLIVEKWSAKKFPVDDLKPAFTISLNNLKYGRSVFTGIVFIAGSFLTFFKLLVGSETAFPGGLFRFLGVTDQLNSWIFIVGFSIAMLLIFIFISVPIVWREHLEPYLDRAIGKHRSAQ